MILAIDPGTIESAWVYYHPVAKRPIKWGKEPNDDVRERLLYNSIEPMETVAIEMVASYGMAVGASVFQTCVWAGRFIECVSRWRVPIREVYRREVKLHLCGSMKAKDPNVTAAIIDRYGIDRRHAVGIKSAPGPLYGMKADCWQALGVAITASETEASS